MDIGRFIRKQVRDALKQAERSGTSATTPVTRSGGTNVAAAVNHGGSGHTTSVYSDDNVTIIRRDGKIQVIPREEEPEP